MRRDIQQCSDMHNLGLDDGNQKECLVSFATDRDERVEPVSSQSCCRLQASGLGQSFDIAKCLSVREMSTKHSLRTSAMTIPNERNPRLEHSMKKSRQQ